MELLQCNECGYEWMDTDIERCPDCGLNNVEVALSPEDQAREEWHDWGDRQYDEYRIRQLAGE